MTRGKRWTGARAAFGLALACAACAPRGEGPVPRLVLLYAPCTVGRAHAGPDAEAPFAGLTPNLERLAREGVVFRRHESEAGQSGIAYASLLSGVQADRHGVYHHPQRLPEELLLAPEVFAEAGWEPWFWSAHPMASRDLNYAQGVSGERTREARGPGKNAQKWSFLQPGDPLFEELLGRLESDPGYRAFAFVCFTVTHGAYQRQMRPAAYRAFLEGHPDLAGDLTPEELERWWRVYDENRLELQWDFPATVERLDLAPAEIERLARALRLTYAANVAALDALFGNVLAQLEERGLADESLIAFTTDHGEVLHRDSALFRWTHGLQLAPEVLGVPWILRSPQHGLAGVTYEGVTRSIDVLPTLAGLCGIDLAGRGIEGVDLSPALLGRTDPPRLVAWSHTSAIGPLHVDDFRSFELAGRFFGSTDLGLMWVRARDGDRVWKHRSLDGTTWGFESFDLATDPAEERDLFDPSDPVDARMAQALLAYKERLLAGARDAGSGGPADALERLRDLGYVR